MNKGMIKFVLKDGAVWMVGTGTAAQTGLFFIAFLGGNGIETVSAGLLMIAAVMMFGHIVSMAMNEYEYGVSRRGQVGP